MGWAIACRKDMKFRHSIRFRFIVILVIFSTVITLSLSAIMMLLQRPFLDGFYEQQLSSELEYYSSRYQPDSPAPPPETRYIISYLGVENLPDKYRPLIGHLPDGIHIEEFEGPDFQKRRKGWRRKFKRERTRYRNRIEYHKLGHWDDLDDDGPPFLIIGIRTLSDGKRLYLIANMDYLEEYFHRIEHSIIAIFVTTCLIAAGLALLLARRVTNPLKKLAGLIETAGPDDLPTGFSESFRKDEFGVLARALEQSMTRVKAFMAREHRFTRDASHELRTPVTVVKGSLELMRQTTAAQDEQVAKLIKRAERSVIDMEITIESLLWLARENAENGVDESCDVRQLVENAVEQNRHLLAEKPVEMTLAIEAEPVIRLLPGVLAIAVSNLIRNAAQFTLQGSVRVILKADRVEVSDTGCGIEPSVLEGIIRPGVSDEESPGFGFGLDIVNRLCIRFGWEFKINSTPEVGTTVQLIFSQKDKIS